MSLSEFGDAYGLILTLSNPGPVAETFGIPVGAEVVRALILLVLALVVAVGALNAAMGLLGRRRALFRAGSLACAAGYAVYGLYQIASGALQLGSVGVVAAGLVYVALGVLAYAMRRSMNPTTSAV
jgi:hypothetical protein